MDIDFHPCVEYHNEKGLHEFYTSGEAFCLMFPRLVNRGSKTADKIRFKIGFNRYPHNIIGVSVVLLSRQYVVNWRC